MKYLFLVILFSFSLQTNASVQISTCDQIQSQVDSSKYGISFDTRSIDLGKVKRGEKASGSYELTNSGGEDITVEFASSCDCTTVSHPFKAIKPGETVKITFVFDSTKKEESGTTDIDLYLNNIDPKTGEPIFEILQYSYILAE